MDTPITYEIIQLMKAHQRRTGLGPGALLRGAKNKPKGLNAGTVGNWLDGMAKTTRREKLVYVLNRWECVSSSEYRVRITNEIQATLRRDQQRTNLSPETLLRGAMDKPEKLNARMIEFWISGRVKTARKEHVDYVLKRWENWANPT